MSRIYTAFNSATGARLASGSIITLRKKVGDVPESQWGIYLYDFKNNVDTLILLLENDMARWPTPEPVEQWRVTKSGQVRKDE